jgi:hypothetical protein
MQPANEKKVLKVQGYSKDETLATDGVPVSFGKNIDGKTSRIAILKPLNSAAYEDRLTALNKASGRAIRRDPEIERANQIKAVAEKVFVSIVQGEIGGQTSAWLDEDGQPIADTFENRAAMLEDRDLFVDVITGAGERETFRRQEFESNLGNSQKSSTGA